MGIVTEAIQQSAQTLDAGVVETLREVSGLQLAIGSVAHIIDAKRGLIRVASIPSGIDLRSRLIQHAHPQTSIGSLVLTIAIPSIEETLALPLNLYNPFPPQFLAEVISTRHNTASVKPLFGLSDPVVVSLPNHSLRGSIPASPDFTSTFRTRVAVGDTVMVVIDYGDLVFGGLLDEQGVPTGHIQNELRVIGIQAPPV